MEGIKEKQELSGEFNHPVDDQIEQQKLGLGFQNLEFSNQTLDHQLVGDQDDGLSKNLSKMTVEGSLNGEEEVSGVVSALSMDEKKSEMEGDVCKEGIFGEEIGGENDQVGDCDLGGFKDSGGEDEAKIEERKPKNCSVMGGNEGDFRELKEGGNDKEGTKWIEIENQVGDHDLEGFTKDEAKIEERKSGMCSVVEENEGEFKEINERGNDKEVSKRSEIVNEVSDLNLEGFTKDEAKIEERKPEMCSVVEENEGDFKEVKEGGNDKEGSKWSEIEDEEENENIEVKDEWVGDEKEAIDGYGNGWGENWEDGAGGIEVNEEHRYFDNYEDERNGKEQYGEVPHWYGNAEGNSVGRNGKEQYYEEPQWYGNAERDSVGLNDGNSGSYHYPLRPDAEDCSFYTRTGTCKFGSNCKFNHPLKRKNEAARDTFKQKEESYDRPGQTECKYYLSSGGCKYGKACRYNHSRGKPAVAPISELNFLGLPIRVGEKECPYYMKNGSCKYGSNCRFHHPNPTVVGEGDTASPSRGSIKDTLSGWSSGRTLNETAPFRPVIYPPSPTAPPNADWNGYQAPVYPTSERNLPIPPAFAMNIPVTDANFYAHPRDQLIVDEFPERPGQPECSYYLKTGDCKYRATCKFHHPKNPKTSITLSDQGLPLRPGQSICSHFSRYGICKFGPACKYDHSVTNGTSASSNGSDQGQYFQYGNSGDGYGEWKMEPMQSV